MIKIKNKEFKFRRGFNKFISENDFKFEDLTFLDFDKCLNEFKIIDKISEIFFYDILCYIKSGINQYKLINYINKCGELNFCKTRFDEYILFCEKFPNVINEERFKLIYGDKWEDEFKKSFYDRITPYKKEYWINKGFSEDESINKIKEYGKNKATSKEGFINRHGIDEGLKKLNKFKESSKHTKEKFISKFGKEEGSLKWNEYLKTKDSMSLNWALNKANGDIELANKIKKERNESVSSNSYNFLLKKFNFNEDALLTEYIRRSKNIKHHSFGRASKESLKYFIPLYKRLRKMGLERKDICIGVKGSYEFRIVDKEKKKTYLYDFTIKSKGIIIEYNGERFHPNYEKYSIEYLNENWKPIRFFNKSTNDAHHYINLDKEKIKIAEQNNFNVLILWSSDSFKINNNKIEKFLIKNNIIKI